MVYSPGLPPDLDPRRDPPGSPEPYRASFLTRLAGICAVLLLLVSAVGWGLMHHLQDSLGRIDVFSGLLGRPAKHSTAVNYLLVGSDTREGMSPDDLGRLHAGSAEQVEGARSDTVVLAHVSTRRRQVTLISFPRDSYLNIPNYTGADGKPHPGYQGKLNSAYHVGGPKLAVAAIEQNTGIRIDHYIEISFVSFVSVVDALGGVDVCTPNPINDPKSGLRLPAGVSHVNGVQGLAYVRARYSLGDGSDLGRINRQQDFMAAMYQQATRSDTLLNPLKLNRVLTTSLHALRADPTLRAEDLADLAGGMRGLTAGNVQFATVPLSNPDYQAPGWGSTVLWDPVASRALFDAVVLDQPPGGPAGHPALPTVPVAPGGIRVQVLDASGTPELADHAAGDLRGLGFDLAGSPERAPGPTVTGTLIRYDPRYSESIKTVRAALPDAQTEQVPGLGRVFQVVVGTGYHGVGRFTVATPNGGPGGANGPGGQPPAPTPTISTHSAAVSRCGRR